MHQLHTIWILNVKPHEKENQLSLIHVPLLPGEKKLTLNALKEPAAAQHRVFLSHVFHLVFEEASTEFDILQP